MHYAEIKNFDIANGFGVRVSLFVSGCPHHCKGCFNEIAWDYNYGKKFTDKEIDEIIELLKPSYIKGLTLLGGEPMYPPNQEALLPLLKKVKETYKDKDIWCYSGYLFDKEIMDDMYDKYPFIFPKPIKVLLLEAVLIKELLMYQKLCKKKVLFWFLSMIRLFKNYRKG